MGEGCVYGGGRYGACGKMRQVESGRRWLESGHAAADEVVWFQMTMTAVWVMTMPVRDAVESIV